MIGIRKIKTNFEERFLEIFLGMFKISITQLHLIISCLL